MRNLSERENETLGEAARRLLQRIDARSNRLPGGHRPGRIQFPSRRGKMVEPSRNCPLGLGSTSQARHLTGANDNRDFSPW